jgi:hypothetical protein
MVTHPQHKLLMGHAPMPTLNLVHKTSSDTCLDGWHTLFCLSDYHGSSFLQLWGDNNKLLIPSYTNGGTWLTYSTDP